MYRSALLIAAILGCASLALAGPTKYQSVMTTLTFENNAAACQRNAETLRKNIAAAVCKVPAAQTRIYGAVKTTYGRRLMRQGADDTHPEDNHGRGGNSVSASVSPYSGGSSSSKSNGHASADVYCQITVLCRGNLQALWNNCHKFRLANNDDKIKARTSPLMDYKSAKCTYSTLY